MSTLGDVALFLSLVWFDVYTTCLCYFAKKVQVLRIDYWLLIYIDIFTSNLRIAERFAQANRMIVDNTKVDHGIRFRLDPQPLCFGLDLPMGNLHKPSNGF